MISIRLKIFATVFALILLLFIIVSTIVYFLFLKSFVQSEVNNAINNTANTNNNLGFILQQVENTATIIAANNTIQQQIETSVMEGGQVNQISALEILTNIQDFVNGIHIVTPEMSIHSSSGTMDKSQIDLLLEMYNEQKDNPGSVYTGLQTITLSTGFTFSVISYVRPVYDYRANNPISMLIVDIDYVRLREVLTAASIDNKEWVLLLDDKNDRVFNYPYNVVLDDLIEGMPQFLRENTVEIDTVVFGQKMIIASNIIENPDWKMIRFIPYDRIQKEINTIQLNSTFIIVIALIISSIISYFIARMITMPIKEINKQFKIAEEGDLSARIQIKSNDEFGELGNSFNKMVIKLKRLMTDQLKEQKRKSDMEFEILQAQINPHFLYNTLDSIKWIASIQNVSNVAEITTALINLLKYNISVKSPTVSLEDEIKSITNYIVIQKYRFGDTFKMVYDIAPETLNCEVLHFMLQPIVENSLLHGIEGIEHTGVITIRSLMEQNQLRIIVEDNGVGMDEMTLNKIQKHKKNDSFNGIGIDNVRARIRLHYGKPFGLFFISKLGKGTTVTIQLPIRKQSKGDKDEKNSDS